MSKTYNCPTFLFTYLISLPISSSSWAMCRILKLKPPCQPDSKHLLVHELYTLSVSSPVCCCVHWLQSCPNPGDPMDCIPPGSSVHGVLQARRKRHLGALLGISQIQGSYGEGESPRIQTCLGYLVFPDLYQWDHFLAEPENASPCLKVANKLDPERNLKISEPEKFKKKKHVDKSKWPWCFGWVRVPEKSVSGRRVLEVRELWRCIRVPLCPWKQWIGKLQQPQPGREIKDQISQERRCEYNCECIQNGWGSQELTCFSHALRQPTTVQQRLSCVP